MSRQYHKTSDRRNKTNDRLSPFNGELDNRQLFQTYRKLYLDKNTADVFFVFNTSEDEVEQVPAHKLLLSMASDGFKKLFDEASDGQTEFKLDDIPIDAFKEYLQFFYMPKLKLKIANVGTIFKLAKDYGNDGFLVICCQYLEQKLTADNIIWGYSLAIRFDRPILKKNCEQRIIGASCDVFKSNNFLECDRDILYQILQIDGLKCYESQLLLACLSWAKASADRKQLDNKNTQVLRDEFGDLLYQIRFKSMSMESFTAIVAAYAGFFNGSELEEIIQMIVVKEYKSEKFNNKFRLFGDNNNFGSKNATDDNRYKTELLFADRIAGTTQTRYYIQKIEKTRFEVNQELLLHSFKCCPVKHTTNNDTKISIPTNVTIIEEVEGQPKPTVIFNGTTTLTDSDVDVQCCSNLIQPNRKYEIILELQGKTTEYCNFLKMNKLVELKNGAKVRFTSDPDRNFDTAQCGIIQRLVFKSTQN